MSKCILCGTETDREYQGYFVCEKCDARLYNKAVVYAGPHAGKRGWERSKAVMFKYAVALSTTTFCDDEGNACFTYRETLDGLEENPDEIGGISKAVGRHIFFKELDKTIRSAMTVGNNQQYGNVYPVRFRTYEETVKSEEKEK